jgi:short subunit dehydrogenase-like uncharacterized protein
MTGPWILYGANGYTGALVARLAASRGHRPILAGRRADAVFALAEELSLERRLFSLEDATRVDEGLRGMSLVLHCAGPFSRTSRPMADACVRTRTHYLDLTGEAEVLEALAARDGEARAAGVMLLPACGFDVVATDCLGAHLKRRLPGARRLALGFEALGGVSRGTALTAIEALPRGGLVRRGGVLTAVPAAWKTRRIDFGRGPRTAMTIPWGDVSTAWRSTGIPDTEIYVAASIALRALARSSRWLRGLLASAPVQRFLEARIRARPSGPSHEDRRRGRTFVWAEAEDDAGGRVTSRLVTPEAYAFTALSALAAVERVLAGQAPAGFQTPSLAFGPDFVLDVEGVARTDEAPAASS